jgi:hypothetical protein
MEKQYSKGHNLKFGTLTIFDELDEFSLIIMTSPTSYTYG